MNVFKLINFCLWEENSVSLEDQTAGRKWRTDHCSVKVEVLGVQTIFGGIMGISHAHVKLLPLHPVATATVANIVTHFSFFITHHTIA